MEFRPTSDRAKSEKTMADLGKSHFEEGLDSGSPFKAGSMAEGIPAPRTLGWVSLKPAPMQLRLRACREHIAQDSVGAD